MTEAPSSTRPAVRQGPARPLPPGLVRWAAIAFLLARAGALLARIGAALRAALGAGLRRIDPRDVVFLVGFALAVAGGAMLSVPWTCLLTGLALMWTSVRRGASRRPPAR